MAFNQTSNFWDRTSYWKELDKDIERYKKSIEESSLDIEGANKLIGDEQSAIIADKNKEFDTNADAYKDRIEDINKKYSSSIEDRRDQAEDLVTRQRDAAGLAANVAAAATGWAGKLSVGQLTSLETDITNQFATSINNSMKDNINFQTDLDSKLSNMGFTTIDKLRVLDEFKKSLSDEEAAPLLDAIASKYTTRIGFMKALSDTISGINKQQVADSTGTIQRSERLERDEEAFTRMTDEQKARDIRDRFWATWNILTPDQKQKIINDTVTGTQSLRETLDMIKNFKSQWATNITERQQVIASGDKEKGEAVFNQGTINLGDKKSTTIGAKDFTGEPTVNTAEEFTNNDDNQTGTSTTGHITAPKEIKAEQDINPGYKVWSTTYVSRDAYKAIVDRKDQLIALKRSDPAKFEKAIALIKEKYTIQ